MNNLYNRILRTNLLVYIAYLFSENGFQYLVLKKMSLYLILSILCIPVMLTMDYSNKPCQLQCQLLIEISFLHTFFCKLCVIYLTIMKKTNWGLRSGMARFLGKPKEAEISKNSKISKKYVHNALLVIILDQSKTLHHRTHLGLHPGPQTGLTG